MQPITFFLFNILVLERMKGKSREKIREEFRSQKSFGGNFRQEPDEVKCRQPGSI
jgi:hypothetical protein